MFELQAKINGKWTKMGEFETDILAICAAEQINFDTSSGHERQRMRLA